MAFLLDTDIAIRVGDRDAEIGGRVASLPGAQSLSLITLIELEGGIVAAQQHAAERRAALAMMLSIFPVLPLDRRVVGAYAGILQETGFSRRRVLDRLIAATALVHDLTLVTINGPDFRDIPGLKLEVWPSPAAQ